MCYCGFCPMERDWMWLLPKSVNTMFQEGECSGNHEAYFSSPKSLYVYIFVNRLSTSSPCQPMNLDCVKTKPSALAQMSSHSQPRQSLDFFVKHFIYCILTEHNNISILDYQYRLLPLRAVDSHKNATCCWAFVKQLVYSPCKNRINVCEELLLHMQN